MRPKKYSLQNISTLILLIGFSTYESVQGQFLYEIDLPNLNVTALAGEWFMVASPLRLDNSSCVTNYVKELSANHFITTIVTKHKNGTRHHSYGDVELYAELENGSNIISTTYGGEKGPSMAVFDVDYNSYMAVYTTMRGRMIPPGDDGIVVIYSRGWTLPDGVFNKIKNSIFYNKADKMNWELRPLNTSNCS